MSRIREIDDIKTALVVIMLLYHAASSLPHYGPFFISFTDKLYFIHFAFVLVSGLLCGLHYNDREKMGVRAVRRELIVRGLKIWGIFLTANVLLYLVGVMHWSSWSEFYRLNQDMPFNINGRTWAFEILYYIGAFLIAASCLLRPLSGWQVLLLGLVGIWFDEYNLVFCLGWGSVGLGLGELVRSHSTSKVLGVLRDWNWCAPLALAVLMVVMHFGKIPHRSYWLLLETLLWFGSFIWLLGLGNCSQRLAAFGRYTMLAYIGQIVLMVALGRVLVRATSWSPIILYVVNLTLIAVILLAAMKVLDEMRRANSKIDRVYQLIFC